MESAAQTFQRVKESNKCTYPGCEKPSSGLCTLPVGKLTESGSIEFQLDTKEKDNGSKCPCDLCHYHLMFAEKKIINLINQEGLIRLVGPFPIIEIVEAVIEAKELEEKMKKSSRKAKKNDNKSKTTKGS